MKILLSAANFCIEPLPVYPLGMGVVARALVEAGHEVAQFDPLVCGRDAYAAEAERMLRAFAPDAVGVSIRNLDVTDSCTADGQFFEATLGVIRTWRRLTDRPIVLGGPGFSMNPQSVLSASGADYGIAGEGERAAVELFGAIAAGKAPPRGTVVRAPAKVILGARYSRKIADWYDRETHNIPIQTKRGCPFRCVYCTYPMLEGHAIRPRPVEDVLSDVAFVKANWPESMVYFTDSVFNDPSRTWEELLRKMVERGLSVPWTGFITPHLLSDADIDLMADSGLISADLGVDGSTDATLAGLGKDFTFADVRRCCAKMLSRNVTVNANAMFGGPGETWQTVKEGIANMRSLEPVFSIIFCGIRVLSGAPLIAAARKQGVIPADWNDTEPLYYYAPGLDAARLHQELLEGFRGSAYCVYPPSSRSDDLRALHRFGFPKIREMRLMRGNGSRRRRT